jgi:hypothetical protein
MPIFDWIVMVRATTIAGMATGRAPAASNNTGDIMTQGNPTSLMRRRLLLGSAAATAAAATGTAGLIVPATARAAAEYPERPITFICPWPVGGTADQSMRRFARWLPASSSSRSWWKTAPAHRA